jgi:hypothetical protein
VKETYKHQLEGLLQARSEDMGVARRRRRTGPVSGPAIDAVVAAATATAAAPASAARCCEECAHEIGARRLRAMPAATRCLHCQRSAERAETPS